MVFYAKKFIVLQKGIDLQEEIHRLAKILTVLRGRWAGSFKKSAVLRFNSQDSGKNLSIYR